MIEEGKSKSNVKYTMLSAEQDPIDFLPTQENFMNIKRIKVENKNLTKEELTTEHTYEDYMKGNNNVNFNFNDGEMTNFKKILDGNKNMEKTRNKNKYKLSRLTMEKIKEARKLDFSSAIQNTFKVNQFHNKGLNFCNDISKIEGGNEDDKKATLLFYKFQMLEIGTTFFTFLTIISTMFTLEFEVIEYFNHEPTLLSSLEAAHTASLIIVSFSVVFFIIIIIFRYYTYFKLLKTTKTIMNVEKFLFSKLFYSLIFEIIVAIIHPNILFKDYRFETDEEWYLVKVKYSANRYIAIFTMLRVLTIIRSILIYMDFSSFRAFRLTRMFGSKLSLIFSLRSAYKQYPYRFIAFYAVFATTVMSYILRIIEGPIYYVRKDMQDSLNDFRSYENCVWNTFVTMTTVGYGDYYQVSNFGRLISIMNCLLGSSLISLTVVTIQNSFAIDENEAKVLEALDRLQDREEMNKLSASKVRAVWDYIKIKNKLIDEMKQTNPNENKIKQAEKELKVAIYERIYYKKLLKNRRHAFRNVYELPTTFDEISEKIEILEDNIKNLEKKVNNPLSHFNQVHTNSSNPHIFLKDNTEGPCCNCRCHKYDQ